MITRTYTGRKRVRPLTRWRGGPLLVLQVEIHEKGYYPDAAKAAIQIIHTRMGDPPPGVPRGNFALEDWLRRRGHAVPWSGSPEMREYRARWLDALIKEFSA